VDVAGEAIELGNDEGGTVQPTKSERFGDSGAVVTLAALDLYHFLHETPSPAIEVVGDRLSLCFEAETADSLSCRRNPQITDKPTLCHKFTCEDICFNADEVLKRGSAQPC
jgi:hypothetical protein